MATSCVFCGAMGKLTAEHAFGDWLTRIGLDLEPRRHGAGRINRSLRDLGISKAFTRKVRDVCDKCNNGWMSTLEGTAARVLSPLIRGTPRAIEDADRAAIAVWTHKTALVNMLMTPDAHQARGDYLLAREFRALHAVHHENVPMAQTRFWIGRYAGNQRSSSAWVTPMIAYVDGMSVPTLPQAYVMTLVVGEVLLQGMRFTTPLLDFEVQPVQKFAQIWPPVAPMTWPAGLAIGDEEFDRVGKGRNLRPQDSRVVLAPWKPAVDLDDSEADGNRVRLPTLCGLHFVFYPGLLVAEAMRGSFYAFVISCECGKRYLIITEADGAHCKAEDGQAPTSEDGVVRIYEDMKGEEIAINDEDGEFVCKRLPAHGGNQSS